jgi:hypothetical protein
MRRVLLVLALVAGMMVVPVRGGAGGCSGPQTKRVVRRFVSAYNHGRFGELDRLFAPGNSFQQYRVLPVERDDPAASDRSSLIPYFRGRHELGDRLRLDSLETGLDANRKRYFQAVVTRTSNDVMPWGNGRFTPSKSGVNGDCTIRLWRQNWQGP